MAEQIPYGVIGSIISRLASSAFHEIGRIYGVRDELQSLNKTVESIKVVLSDAEEKQHHDPTIEHWIRRFKEVLHDADDLLDDLAIKDMRIKVNNHSNVVDKVRYFFSSENPLAFRVKLAHQIENIRKKFNDVAEDMSRLKLNTSLVIPKQDESGWRETGAFVLESDIIGREENKNEIIELLKQINANHNVSLIAIVGMGGLGKTALAQMVYNDAQVQKLFDKQIWVCVSEDFEVKPILNKMLKSLKNDEVGDLELNILQKKLREELNGQRYMLVLDDVWNESQIKWDALRAHLMCGGEGSKVLVTTRSTMVSQIMDINNPYVLKGLSKEQSWTLLKKLTFGEEVGRMSPNQESIGGKIAEKCGGVPLAIKTVGGFLKTKIEEQWSSILYDDVWRLCEERQSIMPVLRLSYQNLPLGLRECFAYCCLYPKDWEIQKDELIQLWMAQGYLESSNEMQSMEDMGNQYVKILLMRSFFQDASLSKFNDIISFKMHDLMHDLAKSIAGNDGYLGSEGKGIVRRPIHVSFVSSTVCSLDSLDVSRLRTLLAKTEVGFAAKPSVIKNLKYLRVLDLSYSSITELSKSIDACKHLKYLDLSNCLRLISLPKSIGNLVSLQSLKLRWCRLLTFCTEIITKLINLRHLDIEGCAAFQDMPVGIGHLTSLQSLSSFAVGDDDKRKCGKLNELKELNNIRGRLRINNLGLVHNVALESQEANLKTKKYIQLLELYWGIGKYYWEEEKENSLQLLDNLCPHQNLKELTVSGYSGVRFSSWLPSLTNIVQICFHNFSNCQNLPPLERLPHLKRLEIHHFDKLEYIYCEEISHVFFPSLEKLVLFNCKNLRGWQWLANDVDDHQLLPPFPHLSRLEIWDCPNLTCMPTYPHVIDLRLDSCSVQSMIETCLVKSSIYPLSGLKHLYINRIDIEALTEEWMESLTSLELLDIRRLLTIAPLLRYLQYLPAKLQTLTIYEVNKLDMLNTQCHVIHGLRSLRKLSIKHCHNLIALPEWICDVQSLSHIEIGYCHHLQSLPVGMCCLTNLKTLHISGCPLLLDRCQTEIGKDWPKIAHIPNIIVD